MRLVLLDAAFAIAFYDTAFDDLTRAATTRAGLRDLEKSARADDLAASAAGRAIDRA